MHLARGRTAKHYTSVEEDKRLAGFHCLPAHYPRSVEQGGDIYIVPVEYEGDRPREETSSRSLAYEGVPPLRHEHSGSHLNTPNVANFSNIRIYGLG